MVDRLEQAAAWIDEVGLALVFPKPDVVLPSLWEHVNGSPEQNWAVRSPDGSFERWTPQMEFLWTAKDALPAAGLACVGRHLARSVACVAPRLVPLLVAANGVAGDGPLVEAVRLHGPATAPELRRATGRTKKEVDRELQALHRGLVLTHSHLVEAHGPWGALAHELVDRKWPSHGPQPREEARRVLARHVLERTGELTAADLGGVFGWPRREAAAVLDEVGRGRDGDGFRIWVRR